MLARPRFGYTTGQPLHNGTPAIGYLNVVALAFMEARQRLKKRGYVFWCGRLTQNRRSNGKIAGKIETTWRSVAHHHSGTSLHRLIKS